MPFGSLRVRQSTAAAVGDLGAKFLESLLSQPAQTEHVGEGRRLVDDMAKMAVATSGFVAIGAVGVVCMFLSHDQEIRPLPGTNVPAKRTKGVPVHPKIDRWGKA